MASIDDENSKEIQDILSRIDAVLDSPPKPLDSPPKPQSFYPVIKNIIMSIAALLLMAYMFNEKWPIDSVRMLLIFVGSAVAFFVSFSICLYFITFSGRPLWMKVVVGLAFLTTGIVCMSIL